MRPHSQTEIFTNARRNLWETGKVGTRVHLVQNLRAEWLMITSSMIVKTLLGK